MSEPSSNGAARQHAILADRVFDGSRWHEHAAVLIEEGRVRGLAPWETLPEGWPQRRLPTGAILAPGFIDLQVNGGGGILLNDDPSAASMQAIARAHRAFGTTGCLPTLITDTRERLAQAVDAIRSAAGHDGVLGLHVEGPFINPSRKGIHAAQFIRRPADPDLEVLSGLRGVGHSMLTLAPECVPSGFIAALSAMDIRVSVGHSEASAHQMDRAVAAGVTGVTHLFNAMPPLQARAPGVVGAALADKRLVAGLIADGIHVDPIAMQAAFAAKRADHMALVTDAMPLVGTDKTSFSFSGRDIRLEDGRLTDEAGTLAGAHLDMASAVRNAIRLAGLPLEDALRAASSTPARFIGLAGERGCLKPGAYADCVALSSDLDVIATWIEGDEDRLE
jgi:N-acetylglucosamine-6-phosphate deacetylase